MKKNCSIVIPLYKQQPDEDEILSLKQCFNVLGKYTVIFVCPQTLELSTYQNLAISSGVEFKIERFNDANFKGLMQYSQLLLSVDFYKRFVEFEYILLYQLDAWVFEDQLEYWCGQQYDYIGAPWFEGYDKAQETSNMISVGGNGGFSLRNVESIIIILNEALTLRARFCSVLSFKQIFMKMGNKHPLLDCLNLPVFLWNRFKPENSVYNTLKRSDIHEDVMLTRVLSKLSLKLRVAPAEIAMYFSFEVLPRRLYKLTEGVLPFGCHAYKKYDYDFWRSFID